ncbi:MAG TPA: hypothetical protein VK728_16600 [Candidatus Sulfotelmatobacter sp.]|nr:hypothetical protein [Candidatus Sulfotelmatobacter sp.]
MVSLPKTRASGDSVPIIPALAEILGAYQRSAGNPELGFVFRSSDGLSISLDIAERRVIRPAFIQVRYLNWAGKETAGVDIFRFDGEGKIVEHWDVLQPVPASSNNRNTMF